MVRKRRVNQPAQQETEGLLALEQEKLHAIIDHLDIGIGIADASGRMLSFNAEAVRIHGFSNEAEMLEALRSDGEYFTARSMDNVPLPPEQWPRARALRGDFVRDLDLIVQRRPAGESKLVRYTFVPIRNAQGDPVMFVCHMRDRTAIEEAEHSRRDSAEFSRSLMESAAEGIVATDLDGTIVRVNASLLALFGYSANELIGQSIDSLLPPERRALHAQHRAEYWKDPRVRRMGMGRELIGMRKDGSTMPLEISLNHVVTSEGARAIAFVTDISERRQAEDALRRSHAELNAYVHELQHRNNQLRRLTSELIMAEHREREHLARTLHDHLQQLLFSATLKRVADQTNGAAELIRQARVDIDEAIGSARTLSVELHPPVLQDAGLPAALEWLLARMRKEYELDLHLSADPEADPAARELRILLFDAVRELVFNAIKHAVGVSRISVALERVAADRLGVTVTDDGKEFDPASVWSTASSPHASLGLLAIRERLTLLGGFIEISNAPDGGARFTLTVPCEESVSGTLPSDDSVQARATEPAKPAIRVLIADDHAVVREGLRQLLMERPELLVIGEATDGAHAVAQAHALRPDVILMDISMPRMDGVEATRRIHAELPQVQIFGLSTQEQGDRLPLIVGAGAVAFFNKGDDVNRLIDRLLAEHRNRNKES
jgi:PAS domain S-box-containing protein